MRRHATIPTRVLVIISTIVVALLLLLAPTVAASGELLASTESYVVRSGDTLWRIAADRTPRGQDLRDTLAAIRSINRLTGSVIYPGQILEVPLDV